MGIGQTPVGCHDGVEKRLCVCMCVRVLDCRCVGASVFLQSAIGVDCSNVVPVMLICRTECYWFLYPPLSLS